MTIPNGICVDLETTISSKIPDHIRPAGKKRFETRILEIGAVDWQNPTRTYQALVNPIPSHVPLQTTKQFFQHFQDTYQHPTRTINFWSKVLVKRHSLTRHMFSVEESPEVWLARQVGHRARDFIRWHNAPATGPMFLSEKKALTGLIRFTLEYEHPLWLAHNGASFDFKVLQGCAERHSVHMPKHIQNVDTLKLFRKYLPGHKSYSQPVLFEKLFKRKYNAHVAIDDAKALATLCQHTARTTVLANAEGTVQKPKPHLKKTSKPHLKKTSKPHLKKTSMDLTFPKNRPVIQHSKDTKRMTKHHHSKSVLRLKGIGPKTAGALTAIGIETIHQLTQQYKRGGSKWLKSILPYGARWKVIAQSIANA